MKTKFTLLLLIFSLVSFSQNLKDKKEKLKSMKIGFITQELDLTPDEATKFWPLYNTFDEKQREIRQEKMKSYMDRLENDNLSEKEASTLLAQMESSEEELFNLRKKFIASLKNVLPATKILKLKRAEEEFNRQLIRQIRGNRKK